MVAEEEEGSSSSTSTSSSEAGTGEIVAEGEQGECGAVAAVTPIRDNAVSTAAATMATAGMQQPGELLVPGTIFVLAPIFFLVVGSQNSARPHAKGDAASSNRDPMPPPPPPANFSDSVSFAVHYVPGRN